MHKVKDYKRFAYFNYKQDPSLKELLGKVLFNVEDQEVGVIIQVHDELMSIEVRTDMWGNCCLTDNPNIRPATGAEIYLHRPDIVPYLKDQWTGEDTNDVDWYEEFNKHATTGYLNPLDVCLLSPKQAASIIKQHE